MIIIKNSSELGIMREAGKISQEALRLAGAAIKPGITTGEIDKIVEKFIRSKGATPSFLGYNGFPASTCISVNDVVIHGIPGKRAIQSGDIVSVDVGAYYKGFHGDNAHTFACGEVSEEAERLMKVTEECLELGIAQAVVGNRIGDVSYAVQAHAETHGYGVVKVFCGHGIGRDMHEDPEVPNYGRAGFGPRLTEGMTIAIEPMINQFGEDVHILEDGWTVLTDDGGLCAHYEHTVAITSSGPILLTQL